MSQRNRRRRHFFGAGGHGAIEHTCFFEVEEVLVPWRRSFSLLTCHNAPKRNSKGPNSKCRISAPDPNCSLPGSHVRLGARARNGAVGSLELGVYLAFEFFFLGGGGGGTPSDIPRPIEFQIRWLGLLGLIAIASDCPKPVETSPVARKAPAKDLESA